MNYYEHEITVKVIDGVLAHEQDWRWFILHTEETFDVQLKDDSLDDVLSSFAEVRDVFYYLSRIREITNQCLPITQDWLKEIDTLVQFYNGTLGIADAHVASNFSAIMKLLIYSGKIYSQIKNQKVFYYSSIFQLRNLSLLDNLELFDVEKQVILDLIDTIKIPFENEKQIFLDNINEVVIPVNQDFITRHKSELNNANCFSFASIVDPQILVWEEYELLKMFAIAVKNGQIVPKITWGETFSPDYTIWTPVCLDHMKDFFSSQEVNFILESIEYLLYKKVPSSDTINKHFSLLYELSERTDQSYQSKMNCSSLQFIISFFSDECKKYISKDSYISYGQVLNKLYDKGCEQLLITIQNRNALANKTIAQKLHTEALVRRDKVGEINCSERFIKYIQDTLIRSSVADNHFEVLSAKFNLIVQKEEFIRVSYLFLEYFTFLLKIKNNKDIIASKISTEIIRIRALWKNKYYKKCCSSMQTVSTGPISIPAEYSNRQQDFIIRFPVLFAKRHMLLDAKSLTQRMQDLSDSPMLMMVSRILICEDFPMYPFLKLDEKHPIDQIYAEFVDQIRNDYAYKFRNSFSTKEYVEGIFGAISSELQFSMATLHNIEALYSAVTAQNPDYTFIDFSPEISLAHITQLFPILENKIRIYGELCGIVPVRESVDECHRLKEPDTVLKLLLLLINTWGGTICDVPDLYFIHFCMFGENGMNIRNACIHGLDYNHGERLVLGFKITLISLYMIGWRTQVAINNIQGQNKNSSKAQEETTQDSHIIRNKLLNNILKFLKKLFSK